MGTQHMTVERRHLGRWCSEAVTLLIKGVREGGSLGLKAHL